MSTNQLPSRPRAEVFIATTVMLSFISFWRAAAIVLSDLASSAYYARENFRFRLTVLKLFC